MKVLLVAVNASYMHTNIAVRSLKAYADNFFGGNRNWNCCDGDRPLDVNQIPDINYVEYTINQPVGEVLRGIGSSNADMVLFSTYIWNAEFVCKILPDIKKILPNCILGAGGPEFGYAAKKYLTKFECLDFIIFGEGEVSFVNILKCNTLSEMENVPGIYSRGEIIGIDGDSPQIRQIRYSGVCPLIKNIDDLPFVYPEIQTGNFDPDHKIYYYESSRGCPFCCSYCLSSVDKSVRFKSLEKVYEELKIFIDANVKLVKFVDRTYNLKPERYIKIWEYILKNHNGKTMFHFEIEAEQLSDEALEFLQRVPDGVMQFEMGIQSANKQTLETVNRSSNIEKLAENIKRIPRTIHQHLDLIAGLPYEDLESFGRSYDFAIGLSPDALQLGFLKILNGTEMEAYAKKNGWKWMENPVYETFSTPYLSFAEIGYLKNIEIITDEYWNKGIFSKIFQYIFRYVSPWKFMCAVTDFGLEEGTFLQARNDSYWFEFLSRFCKSSYMKNFLELDCLLVEDLIRYDYVRFGKKGSYPLWYNHNYDKEKHRALLAAEGLLQNSRIAFSLSEYEVFNYDVTSSFPENNYGRFELLIKYK